MPETKEGKNRQVKVRNNNNKYLLFEKMYRGKKIRSSILKKQLYSTEKVYQVYSEQVMSGYFFFTFVVKACQFKLLNGHPVT